MRCNADTLILYLEEMMEDKIAIYSKNLEISDRTHDYVISKIGKVDRFLQDIDEIRVDLSHMKNARNAADRYSSCGRKKKPMTFPSPSMHPWTR